MRDDELSIREAAALLGKSEHWIRTQIRQGILPARQEEMGEIYAWRIKKSALEEWAARPAPPRGRAAGAKGCARYVVKVPVSIVNERLLILTVQSIENATLQRGRGTILVDTRKKEHDTP